LNLQEIKRTTLAEVPRENAFVVHRGDVITHVSDMANCIEHLSEEEFRHHVHYNGDHNHFADWVEHVLKNPGLAKDLRYPINQQDKLHAAKTIRDHVAWLESI